MKFIILLFIFFSNSAFSNTCMNAEFKFRILNKIGYSKTDSSLNKLDSFCTYESWINSQLSLTSDDLVDKYLSTNTLHNKNQIYLLNKYPGELSYDQTSILTKELIDKNFIYALYSENRVREMMVSFWLEHFNIYSENGTVLYLSSYIDTVRKHSLGKFENLFKEVIQHPAMIVYLDNDSNNAPIFEKNNLKFGGNNHASHRILESFAGHYNANDKDIENLQKILTGFKNIELLDKQPYPKNINTPNDLMFFYSQSKNKKLEKFDNGQNKHLYISKVYDNFTSYSDKYHEKSTKKILNQDITETSDKELIQAISIISSNDKTISYINKKIATYFLGGSPSKYLLNSINDVYKKNNGDISSVVKFILTSKEFTDSLSVKKQPKNEYEYILSTIKKLTNNNPIKKESLQLIYNDIINLKIGYFSKKNNDFSINDSLHEHKIRTYINFINKLESNYYKINYPSNINIKYLLSKDWIYK